LDFSQSWQHQSGDFFAYFYQMKKHKLRKAVQRLKIHKPGVLLWNNRANQ
jgi:hypothetical protein